MRPLGPIVRAGNPTGFRQQGVPNMRLLLRIATLVVFAIWGSSAFAQTTSPAFKRDAHMARAFVALFLHDMPRAITENEQAAVMHSDASVLYQRAFLRTIEGDYSKAEVALKLGDLFPTPFGRSAQEKKLVSGVLHAFLHEARGDRAKFFADMASRDSNFFGVNVTPVAMLFLVPLRDAYHRRIDEALSFEVGWAMLEKQFEHTNKPTNELVLGLRWLMLFVAQDYQRAYETARALREATSSIDQDVAPMMLALHYGRLGDVEKLRALVSGEHSQMAKEVLVLGAIAAEFSLADPSVAHKLYQEAAAAQRGLFGYSVVDEALVEIGLAATGKPR